MRRLLIVLVLLSGISPAIAQNYTATQGAGLTFGSKLVTAVNYPQIVFCDPTTPAQCVGVNASGQITVLLGGGSAIVGKVGIDQTTPGTTNLVSIGTNGSVTANAGTNLNTSALATSANQATNAATTAHTCSVAGFSELGCLGQIDDDIKGPIPTGSNYTGQSSPDPSKGGGTPSSVAINVSTATTTQLVAISGSTSIYITSFDVIAGGTGNITFEYGTGASCGTGTTALTGAYNLTAQAGIAKGNGLGTVLKVPSGNALCVLTSAVVQMSGSVSFQQF